jgi:hypothetical protein
MDQTVMIFGRPFLLGGLYEPRADVPGRSWQGARVLLRFTPGGLSGMVTYRDGWLERRTTGAVWAGWAGDLLA